MRLVGRLKADWLRFGLLSRAAMALAALSAAHTVVPSALAGTGPESANHCSQMPERYLLVDSGQSAVSPAGTQGNVTDYPLGVGDTVQIRIYGREDLSGEFPIATDGSITVPLVGALEIAGKTRAEAKAALTEALGDSSVRTRDISFEVTQWRPLYVVGGVDKPGTFAFQPGMTVLHALAVAGGFYRPGAFPSVIVDSARARKDLQEAKLQLTQALARRARLEAEINGQQSAEVPKALGQFLDEVSRERLMAGENRILTRRRLSQRTQDASLREQIGHVISERSAYQQQLAMVEQQIDLTKEELSRIKGLSKRGLTGQIRVFQAERQVTELQGQARDIAAAISRSQRTLVVAEREHAQLDIQRQLEIERELRDTHAEILRARQAKRAAETLLRQLSRLSPEAVSATSEPAADYEIMRVIGGERVTFDAPKTALLCPGDVIHVVLEASPLRSSAAQN